MMEKNGESDGNEKEKEKRTRTGSGKPVEKKEKKEGKTRIPGLTPGKELEAQPQQQQQ